MENSQISSRFLDLSNEERKHVTCKLKQKLKDESKSECHKNVCGKLRFIFISPPLRKLNYGIKLQGKERVGRRKFYVLTEISRDSRELLSKGCVRLLWLHFPVKDAGKQKYEKNEQN